MVSYIASRIIMLVFGTLYPAYSSYKAIKTKNTREYVRWMMYWVVFALFTTVELFADLLLGVWFPFYYEIKIIFMIWLLSPTTKGSTILYRKFVHPWLSTHETEIDSYLDQAKESGYETLVRVSRNTVNIAAETMMKTAITGQNVLAEKLRQYGSDQVEGSKENRLRKAKSWYGGMESLQNDYNPIDETGGITEEENEDEEQRPVSPETESSKLNEDINEKTSKRKDKNYSSSTLPRSFARSSTYSRLYEDYNGQPLSSQYSSGDSLEYETHQSSTLPRNYSSRTGPGYSTRSRTKYT